MINRTTLGTHPILLSDLSASLNVTKHLVDPYLTVALGGASSYISIVRRANTWQVYAFMQVLHPIPA